MAAGDFRDRADQVRAIPLETVLTWWNADRDEADRSRWRTEHGTLSITGSKFFHWQKQVGGGGAIDLVVHLSGWSPRQAIHWLDGQLHGTGCAVSATSLTLPTNCRSGPPRRLWNMPQPEPTQLARVRQYLTRQRGLALPIVESLINAGNLFADRHGNAVFTMVAGKANRPIGAELRGTGSQVWRGLAPGSCKNAGYFWIGIPDAHQHIVLCESAIDAISCFQLDRSRICISTAGVRTNPPWLRPLLTRGTPIQCGYDNDLAGNAAAKRMISLHPAIQRLTPPASDWNDVLTRR